MVQTQAHLGTEQVVSADRTQSKYLTQNWDSALMCWGYLPDQSLSLNSALYKTCPRKPHSSGTHESLLTIVTSMEEVLASNLSNSKNKFVLLKDVEFGKTS